MKSFRLTPSVHWVLWVLVLWFWVAFGGCLKVISSADAPCQKDEDCFDKLWCVAGKCSTTDLPPVTQPEPRVEPVQEPTKEPTVEKRGEPDITPEPQAEPPPADDAGVGQDVPPQQPPPPGRQTLNRPCHWVSWGAPGERCEPGLICHRVNAFKASCLKDCSENVRPCINNGNQTTCRTIDWDTAGKAIKACVSEVNVGDSCNEEQGIFCRSTADKGAVCTGGKCVEVKIANTGESCHPKATPPLICNVQQQEICGSGGLCVKGRRKFEQDGCSNDELCPTGTKCMDLVNSRHCLRTCTTTDDCKPHYEGLNVRCSNGVCLQTGCADDLDCRFRDAGTQCIPTSQGSKDCVPRSDAGQSGESEVCDGPLRECRGQLRCVSTSDATRKGVCLGQCKSTSDCARYDSSYRCLKGSASGAGYCFRPCQDDKVCSPGTTCNAQYGFCAVWE